VVLLVRVQLVEALAQRLVAALLRLRRERAVEQRLRLLGGACKL